MCGKAYDPRLIVAWPTAKIAVMGGSQAATTLAQIQVASMKSKGREDQMKKMPSECLMKYPLSIKSKRLPIMLSPARLWVDAIIDPIETRKIISMGIEMANHAPVEKFNPGVLQT